MVMLCLSCSHNEKIYDGVVSTITLQYALNKKYGLKSIKMTVNHNLVLEILSQTIV